jgi:cysteine desulfurase/selenocysteine lyase
VTHGPPDSIGNGLVSKPSAVRNGLRSFSDLRDDFPILGRESASGAPLVYLDNAASTQRPSAVLEAMDDCYRRFYSNVHRGIHTLSEESTEHFELARQGVAEFINASPRETIFTSGTTASINLVARSWGDQNVGVDDVILLTIAEHHANIVPWHQLADRTGCRLEFIPLGDDFTIEAETVREHLERLRPKMFAFTAASNVLGAATPVAQWTSLAHQFSATVLVDAAQAVPHQTVDVQQWDADFVAFSGHKMCGPSGIGVLYGKESLLESMPPFLGGGGMIRKVTTTGFEAGDLPEKFEAGTPPIAESIGLKAGVEYLNSIGLDRIAQHEHELVARADSGLRAVDGVRVIGPSIDTKIGILSFHLDHAHAHDVAQTLDQLGIAVRAGHHCTMPLHDALGLSATTRASFYLYNTTDEVDQLIDAVKQVSGRFMPSGRRRRRRNKDD